MLLRAAHQSGNAMEFLHFFLFLTMSTVVRSENTTIPVNFWLFTKDNLIEYEVMEFDGLTVTLVPDTLFDPSKTTKVVVHGWGWHPTALTLVRLPRHVHLQKYLMRTVRLMIVSALWIGNLCENMKSITRYLTQVSQTRNGKGNRYPSWYVRPCLYFKPLKWIFQGFLTITPDTLVVPCIVGYEYHLVDFGQRI